MATATVFDDLGTAPSNGTVFDDITAPPPGPPRPPLPYGLQPGRSFMESIANRPVESVADRTVMTSQIPEGAVDIAAGHPLRGLARMATPFLLSLPTAIGADSAQIPAAVSSATRAGMRQAAATPVSKVTVPGAVGAAAGYGVARSVGLPWEFALPAGGVGAAVGSKTPAFIRGAVRDLRGLPEIPAERPVMAPPPVKFKPTPEPEVTRMPAPPVKFKPQEAAPKTYPAPPVNFKTNLTPPPAAGADDFLEGLAQSQTGKSFAKLPAEQQQAVRQLADRIQPSSQPQQPALPPPPKSEPAPQGRYGDLRQQHGGIYAANAEAKDIAVATYLRQKGITPEQWEKMDLNTQNAHIKATNPSYQPYKVEGSGGRRLGRPAAEGIADISTKLRNLWGK